MRALCFGLTTYNVICNLNTFPIEGKKYETDDSVECGGGFAYDTAYLLSSWGIQTNIASVVGNDDYGKRIKKDLEQIKVNTDYLETSFDKPTLFSIALVNKSNGSSTPINIIEERSRLKKEDWAISPNLIVGDSSEYKAFLKAIHTFPNAETFIFAKQGDLETRELCKNCKYILAELAFVEEETGLRADFNNPATLVAMYNKLLSIYPNSKPVVTLGSNGAMYSDNGKISLVQGLKVDVNDCTGSDNIFRAAFVYGIASNYDIEKCIRIANIAAGLSVQRVGSKSSIPALSEVLGYYTKKFGNQTNGVPQINNNVEISNSTSQDVNAESNIVQTDTAVEETLENEPVSEEVKEEIQENIPEEANPNSDTNSSVNPNNPGINPPSF